MIENQNQEDIRNSLINIAKIIESTYNDFKIIVRCIAINIIDEYAEFCITPDKGVRVKTVLKYEEDLSLRICANVKIKPKFEEGCISIFVPIEAIYKN